MLWEVFMKRSILALLVIIALLSLASVHPTQAATYSATYTLGTGTCTTTTFSVPGTYAFNFPPVSGIGHYVETVNGTTIFDSGQYPLLTGVVPTTNATFEPVGAYTQAGNYTWVRTYDFADSGGTVFSHNVLTVQCTIGTGVAVGSTVNTTGGSMDFSGPALPGGFVLKTITCDVAVFDAPGGKPVGSNMIKGGQTWYVNPTPKKDAAGKSWTEVFVAGYTNGYVPTSCVH
jgi:hypothetical protein